MNTQTVEFDCPACSGTGLYHGFMEKPGEFVVCVRCGGTGKVQMNYVPFTKRKERKGVKKVRFGSGTILDSTKNSEWMTYEEFKRKIK